MENVNTGWLTINAIPSQAEISNCRSLTNETGVLVNEIRVAAVFHGETNKFRLTRWHK